MNAKPKIAVHKFASCDGCQLAFLNLGEELLALAELVEIMHFAEAGPVNLDAQVDIAFIEGSVSTPDDLVRIQKIRANTRFLITIGACATSGGVQALRNLADGREWIASVYAQPEYIESLATSTSIASHVKVDLELWGCPVSGRQVLAAVRALLFGVAPVEERDKVCMECKRTQAVCVLVAKGVPCLGPVTRTGCGALCPRFGRDCYGCYGPAENPNTEALGLRFAGLGLLPEQIARRFLFIDNAAPVFAEAGARWRSAADD
ncbi:MAG: sulfhydrogenase subunit delta [Candidatus Muproteobacteria bacterium RBG_16_65_34]|uniref:Sulfhydrogenase subunit delta n=1 Tax=Candidatus Muproteobacteria bacterium RBG_16_65_34 TaxID=1817760 RepID=A0A1F6TRU6_9PROT|nr:MAG: sulfhydrogenase subunit delta [Candidatus Muproteobacteria bacterium RBG_16_65_34]